MKEKINCLFSTFMTAGALSLVIGLSSAVAAPPSHIGKDGPAIPREWNSLVAAAQKEGKVTLYGQISGAAQKALSKALESKLKITAQFVSGRGSEIANKIVAEQNGGLYIADIIFATTTSVITVLIPQEKVHPTSSGSPGKNMSILLRKNFNS